MSRENHFGAATSPGPSQRLAAESLWDTWWSKGEIDPRVASVVNRATHPLLIVSQDWPSVCHLLSVTNSLDPNVSIRLAERSKMPPIPEKLENVFILDASNELRRIFEQNGFRLEAASAQTLWRLTRNPSD